MRRCTPELALSENTTPLFRLITLPLHLSNARLRTRIPHVHSFCRFTFAFRPPGTNRRRAFRNRLAPALQRHSFFSKSAADDDTEKQRGIHAAED